MTDIETSHGSKASGVAKAGLTLGIIGTSLAGLLATGGINPGFGGCNGNGWNGWNLGGIFNGNRGCNGCGVWSAVEHQQSYISKLESDIARLESERYTDYVGLDLYKNIVSYSDREDQKIKELQDTSFAYIFDIDKRTALNAQATELNRQYDAMARDYQFMLMNNKIDASVSALEAKINCCCEKAEMRTAFNQQMNEFADASIISYVNSNFIPGTLKLPASTICPPVQLA